MGFRFSKTDVCWNAMLDVNFKANKLFNERPMNVIIRWSFYFVEKKRLFGSVENKTYFQ
ncbi:TPA: hypothetical protein R9Z04_001040 [Bacillus cereus]|nr:hypothetical protein [Bacillus cereus]